MKHPINDKLERKKNYMHTRGRLAMDSCIHTKLLQIYMINAFTTIYETKNNEMKGLEITFTSHFHNPMVSL